MSIPRSKLCHGLVVHRRYRPKLHALRYRVFSLLIDLDEAEALSARLNLFSFNRANLFSLREADHGDASAAGLKRAIVKKVHAAVPEVAIERVLIFCFPRVLGYVFNPLTVFYCFSRDERLRAIVYEVNNTFGDRHHYVLPVAEDADQPVAQSCSKKMYVSPFNAVEGEYEFHVSPPSEKLVVGVNLRVDGAPVLKAYLCANTQTLSDRSLIRAFFGMPAMTFKVVAGIHWEALLLWLKGLKTVKRPRSLKLGVPLSIKNKSNP